MRAITRADTYEIKAPPPPDPDSARRLAVKAPQVVKTIESLRNKGEGRRFEPDVTRNPYAPKTWVSYLAATRDDFSFAERRLIYERALQLLPRSYKLWRLYLDEVEEAVRDRWHTSGRAKVLVLLYERCLMHLSKMPLAARSSFLKASLNLLQEKMAAGGGGGGQQLLLVQAVQGGNRQPMKS